MKTTRGFEHDSDRYKYDFNACHFKKGWAQIDTSQDAWYFGTWCNPFELIIFSYIEGDTCLEECENEAEFIEAIRIYQQWNYDQGHKFHIDPMCVQRMIDKFTELGLDDLLH